MKTCMRWKSAVRSTLSPDRPYSMAAPSFHPTTNESRSVPAAPARQPTSGLPTQRHIRNSSRTDRDVACSPAWPRDGSSVAFDSRGGTGESRSFRSTWSGASHATTNGHAIGDAELVSKRQWIYFSWDQGRGRDIWRVQRTGGAPERVTTTGAMTAVESADGATLFYLAPRTITHPRANGRAADGAVANRWSTSEVIPCVMARHFPSAALSITFRAAPCRPRIDVIPPYSSSTFQPARGARWDTRDTTQNALRFSASSDGRTFLYSRLVNRGEDLMLIENFIAQTRLIVVPTT